jgi:hypothetical protein
VLRSGSRIAVFAFIGVMLSAFFVRRAKSADGATADFELGGEGSVKAVGVAKELPHGYDIGLDGVEETK